jgi:hypothetical protein
MFAEAPPAVATLVPVAPVEETVVSAASIVVFEVVDGVSASARSDIPLGGVTVVARAVAKKPTSTSPEVADTEGAVIEVLDAFAWPAEAPTALTPLYADTATAAAWALLNVNV